MKAVRFHLEGGQFTRALLIGNTLCVPNLHTLVVDLSTPEGQSVVGADGWFSEEYVRQFQGLVPEAAKHGTEPGEWSDYPMQQDGEATR